MTTILLDADGAQLLFDDGSQQLAELGTVPITGSVTFTAQKRRTEFTEKPAVSMFAAKTIRRIFR